MSIIGTYAGTMFVAGDPPYHIPKFGFLVEYLEGRNANSPPLVLQIYLPGDGDESPTYGFDLPPPPNDTPRDPLLSEESYVGSLIPILLAPFVVPSEGMIKVRMKRGDDHVRLGSLVVRTAPPVPTPGGLFVVQDSEPG